MEQEVMQAIRAELESNIDAKYREFHSSLVPGQNCRIREQEHFVVFADFSKPGGNSKKSDGCQQLVGCTEQRPDFGITGQAKADAEYYGDNG